MNFGNSGPGSKNLLGGNEELGFFGEVESSKLIDGLTLARITTLSAGVNINSDTSWLKFVRKGKILFVAKKPFKHSISWDHLDEMSLVYGNRLVKIKEKFYRIRLMEGSESIPSFWEHQEEGAYYDPPVTHRSEWNDLMYPIHIDEPRSQHIDNYTPPEFDYDDGNGFSSNVSIIIMTRQTITEGETRYLENYLNEQQIYDYLASIWKPYNDEELNVADNYGRNTWCQETWGYNEEFRIQRGCRSIDYTTIRRSWEVNDSYGWRPVLELLSDDEANKLLNT